MQVASPDEYLELMHHRAMHQVNQVLNVCLHSPRTEEKWTCLKREKRMELYAKKSNTTRSVFFLGVNEIQCRFDEMYELLNYRSTPAFRQFMRQVYGRNFRDGAVMSTHEPREYDEDYDVADVRHSAVWFSLQARRDSMLRNDNMLTFFQALMILHPDRGSTAASTMTAHVRPSECIKKRTLALTWLPFYQTEELAHVQDSLRLQYTLIVEEVGRQRLHLSCVATSFRDGDDFQPRSHGAARQVAQRLVKRSVTKLENAIMAARIHRQELMSPLEWVRNEERDACVVCWKQFKSLYRRRHHCRFCGEVICGSCSSFREITDLHHRGGFTKVRICHLCNNPRRLRNESFVSSPAASLPQRQVGEDSRISSTQAYFPNTTGLPPPHRQRRRPPTETTNDLPPRQRGEDDAQKKKKVTVYDADEDDYVDGELLEMSDGYMGNFFVLPNGYSSNQKIISIRSLTPSEILGRSSSSSSTTASCATIPTNSWRVPMSVSTNTIQNTLSPAMAMMAMYARRTAEANWRAESYSLSFLHPAALQPDRVNVPAKSIVADIGSNERATFLSDSKKPSSNGSSDVPRRTSITSLGMFEVLDGTDCASSVDARGSTFCGPPLAPRLDPESEMRRLKLMQVICSPACTLVERALMHACCVQVVSAFGVMGAFIARVEETDVVIEHVIGTREIVACDQYLRSDTLCDHVLVATGCPPLCVVDCMSDARTREMAMVQDLRISLFAA
ncbi:hypothetical protein Poli38472_003925 [Pythium oligandrum]|uniref:FYVE-type domain-containing protein n=1 Tax=Pythium oligandrum TaxID=41045 RepID=A0A8K1CMQ7_PYTOL|nr:hypothetical protein Poli38472_003925 [Pythium oligandrum]|eukprot:TMW66160.1 hypothetical protein Poli38472_003925 [Pythium oligandrum]